MEKRAAPARKKTALSCEEKAGCPFSLSFAPTLPHLLHLYSTLLDSTLLHRMYSNHMHTTRPIVAAARRLPPPSVPDQASTHREQDMVPRQYTNTHIMPRPTSPRYFLFLSSPHSASYPPQYTSLFICCTAYGSFASCTIHQVAGTPEPPCRVSLPFSTPGMRQK